MPAGGRARRAAHESGGSEWEVRRTAGGGYPPRWVGLGCQQVWVMPRRRWGGWEPARPGRGTAGERLELRRRRKRRGCARGPLRGAPPLPDSNARRRGAGRARRPPETASCHVGAPPTAPAARSGPHSAPASEGERQPVLLEGALLLSRWVAGRRGLLGRGGAAVGHIINAWAHRAPSAASAGGGAFAGEGGACRPSRCSPRC